MERRKFKGGMMRFPASEYSDRIINLNKQEERFLEIKIKRIGKEEQFCLNAINKDIKKLENEIETKQEEFRALNRNNKMKLLNETLHKDLLKKLQDTAFIFFNDIPSVAGAHTRGKNLSAHARLMSVSSSSLDNLKLETQSIEHVRPKTVIDRYNFEIRNEDESEELKSIHNEQQVSILDDEQNPISNQPEKEQNVPPRENEIKAVESFSSISSQTLIKSCLTTPSPILPELVTQKEQHLVAIEKKPISVNKKATFNKENVKQTSNKKRNLSQEPNQITRQSVARKMSTNLIDLNQSTIKIDKPRLSVPNQIESNKFQVKQKPLVYNKNAHKPKKNKEKEEESIKKTVVAITRIEFSDLDIPQNVSTHFDKNNSKLIRLPLLNKK